MDYGRIYAELITHAELRQFINPLPLHTYERHHTVPKAFGGTDEPSNIVQLTLREHILAHTLLALTVDPNQWFAVEICRCRTLQPLPRWKRKQIALQRAVIHRLKKLVKRS